MKTTTKEQFPSELDWRKYHARNHHGWFLKCKECAEKMGAQQDEQKVIFQFTEAQLKQMVWNLKNYGKDPNEETNPTPSELTEARALAKEYFEGLEEQISGSMY